MQPTHSHEGKSPIEGKTPTLICSVGRALDVLDCLGSASRPLPAKSIARATQLSLGTTYNLLRTLASSGYVVQDSDGFLLGPAHPALAATGGAVALARGRAVLNALRDELNAATYLARFRDGEIELLDIADSPSAPRVDLWVGLADAAHATAFGKAILAGLTPEVRRDYLSRHPLAPLTPHTLTSPREFLQMLDAGPSARYDDQEYALGVRCAAVTVAAPGWAGALAISLPLAQGRPGPGHVRTLERAATRLELALGADGGTGVGH